MRSFTHFWKRVKEQWGAVQSLKARRAFFLFCDFSVKQISQIRLQLRSK